MRIVVCLFLGFLVVSWAKAQDWTLEQQEVIDAIGALSASTAPGGGGGEVYRSMLDPAFSRWTMGSHQMVDRDRWVAGVADWFDDGWYVKERSDSTLQVEVAGDLAFTRRIVTETFASPNDVVGEPSTAALAEVWRRHEGSWRLLRVEVVVVD